MADTFGLEIYASNKLAFAGRAKTLTIPAVDGEQAFLAQHENIVAAIIPGEMRFEEADGTKHVLAVSRRADETEAEYSGVSYESAGSVQSYGTT